MAELPRAAPEEGADFQPKPLAKSITAAAALKAKNRPGNKKWPTELARSTSLTDDVPFEKLDRAGTSNLDRAIWEGNQADSDTDSSEDEDVPIPDDDVTTVGFPAVKKLDISELKKEESFIPEKLKKTKSKTAGFWSKKREKWCPDHYHRFRVGNDNYHTKGKVKKDGRLRISLNDTSHTGYVTRALEAAYQRMIPSTRFGTDGANSPSDRVSERRFSAASTAAASIEPKPRLNIVIMVIGSRGDVQPFIKIGKILKEEHGHRVRIATHPVFRDFVEREAGLELFSVGGDPSELMAFMVKNPGMIPKLETVKAGEIGKRRDAMAGMFEGFWKACVSATDDEEDNQNMKMMGVKEPFIADAIIANPPSFAHIHCAEALGIPLHLMFTFPYTPTQAFPHPLASIKRSNVDPGYTNFLSYPLVEMMVWQGLGDLVNDFRVHTLGLDPVSTLWAPGSTYRLHVPFTYLWSPGLIPKPNDWGPEIDISGFVFLDLAKTYKPPKALADFLDAGEPPIYIGFGSIVVDDADRFTEMIFKAVEMAGVRALVSKGWGGFGAGKVPDNIFLLDNVPHDWLFPRVKGTVIHGGAGTTAIALKCGKPTMVVPFFGDQFFWGSMIGRSGVGPDPVPYKELSVEKLAEGIKYLTTAAAEEAAGKVAKSIELEGDGAANAVASFHKNLSLNGPKSMRCAILPDRVAGWQVKTSRVKLSPLAADTLVSNGVLTWKQLRLVRYHEWEDLTGPVEPLSGLATSITGTVGNTIVGVGSIPYKMATGRRRGKSDATLPSPRQGAMNSATSSPQPNGMFSTADHTRPRGQSNATNASGSTAMSATEDFVGYLVSGVGKTAGALAKAPADLSVALAQGFHNMPRLYGDDTVRRPRRVTGIQSGLIAARDEFVYGIFDGWTGVIRLPIRGAKKQGVVGFLKGTAKGTFGFVLKNLSAIIGPVGYTMKGVVKQVERAGGPRKQLRRVRISQGRRQARELSRDARKQIDEEVLTGYAVMNGLYEEILKKERQGDIVVHFGRVFGDVAALFEDVETASRAVEGLRQGKSLSQVRIEAVEHAAARTSGEGPTRPRRNTNLKRSLTFQKTVLDAMILKGTEKKTFDKSGEFGKKADLDGTTLDEFTPLRTVQTAA